MEITVPLYVFLFIYLLFLTVFVVFTVINLYHIFASASFTLASFAMSFFIFASTVMVFYVTFQLLVDVNWQQTVTLFTTQWINGPPPNTFP